MTDMITSFAIPRRCAGRYDGEQASEDAIEQQPGDGPIVVDGSGIVTFTWGWCDGFVRGMNDTDRMFHYHGFTGTHRATLIEALERRNVADRAVVE